MIWWWYDKIYIVFCQLLICSPLKKHDILLNYIILQQVLSEDCDQIAKVSKKDCEQSLFCSKLSGDEHKTGMRAWLGAWHGRGEGDEFLRRLCDPLPPVTAVLYYRWLAAGLHDKIISQGEGGSQSLRVARTSEHEWKGDFRFHFRSYSFKKLSGSLRLTSLLETFLPIFWR